MGGGEQAMAKLYFLIETEGRSLYKVSEKEDLKMKRIIFYVVLMMAVAISTSAFAQNQSYKPYKWTGFYVGMQGMYLNGNSNWEMAYEGNRIDHDLEGGMGGFFLGFNYQTPVNLVVGIDTELNFGNADGSSACPNATFSCNSDLYWLGSTKFRLGYALDRFMPYVSIGWAYGGGEVYVRDLYTGREFKSDDNAYFGFTPGIGFEFAITNNLLLRAEYNYYYFFRSEQEIDSTRADIQTDTSAFKLGLSFKF